MWMHLVAISHGPLHLWLNCLAGAGYAIWGPQWWGLGDWNGKMVCANIVSWCPKRYDSDRLLRTAARLLHEPSSWGLTGPHLCGRAVAALQRPLLDLVLRYHWNPLREIFPQTATRSDPPIVNRAAVWFGVPLPLLVPPCTVSSIIHAVREFFVLTANLIDTPQR